MLNWDLLKNPQNWARVWIMATIALIALFLVFHFISPKAVGETS